MRVTILATTAMVGLCFVVVCASSGRLKGRVTDKQSGEPVIGASVSVVGTPMGARTDVDGKYQILRIEPGVYSLRVSHMDYASYTLDSAVVEEGTMSTLFGRKGTSLDIDLYLKSEVGAIGVVIKVRADPAFLPPFGDPTVGPKTVIDSVDAAFSRMRDSLLVQETGLRLSENGEVFIRGGRAGEISCMYFFPLPSPLDFLASSPFDVDQASPPGSSIQGVTILRRSDVQPHDDEFAPITPLEFSLDFTKSRPLHSKH